MDLLPGELPSASFSFLGQAFETDVEFDGVRDTTRVFIGRDRVSPKRMPFRLQTPNPSPSLSVAGSQHQKGQTIGQSPRRDEASASANRTLAITGGSGGGGGKK